MGQRVGGSVRPDKNPLGLECQMVFGSPSRAQMVPLENAGQRLEIDGFAARAMVAGRSLKTTWS